MKKVVLLLVVFMFGGLSSFATEGMWIPSLIDMFYSDMKTYGLKLDKDQIYNTNNTSLKDAVLQFNGGCTAELVSNEGLILTNHHCGFDAIQKHSSLENDLLKNGFWAKDKASELACPWLHVTFVKRIEDVTSQVFNGVTAEMDLLSRSKTIEKNIKELEKKAVEGNSYQAKIKPFNLGNEYYMLVTQDFNDIRLVGTPPSAIGKFGGDTDNWVWPRHTGDFSVFRIYSNDLNEPAQHNVVNKPYQPLHFLPISLKPIQKNDFTMVYGFPGSTDQHFSSKKLQFYMAHERPLRIAMRQQTIDILKPAMRENDLIRIQYASKQARLANAWKKWIGQLKGLTELGALDKKKNWEETYLLKASERTLWKEKYYPLIEQLANLQENNGKYELAFAMLVEYFYYGPEFIKYAQSFNTLIHDYTKLEADDLLNAEVEKLKKITQSFFKNYNVAIDQKIYNALTPMYIENVDAALLPSGLKENWASIGAKIFKKSIFLNEEKMMTYLNGFSKKQHKKLAKDPAFLHANSIINAYREKVARAFSKFSQQEEELMKLYLEGIMVMFPDKKTWPDANSTLRITYGKVDGSAPYDGMTYKHYTTIDGIFQKNAENNPDFEVTDRLRELYLKKDYGAYTQDGELWVCFTASNHTTGGNSGSPVIDAEGNLMGINFDRSWESTMSDFYFDESRCRNIAVDIRYVLWVIDKYGNAKHLVDEMTLIK
ncbi:S46 family peptidase [Putridiphycobacter roseus]|uniref:Dipeptidyl-peptidase n=1 Tax=Putridiphycobacter roseus TaxID=2219161 RepID=A0A2W1MWF3_9FLAO|nr:S46 family peptidase [Putridiphycobacter roseus]PZE15714.1 S46 family peptidase [Putridiphycobacter roseus]